MRKPIERQKNHVPPEDGRAENDLGVVLAKRGDLSGAAEHFQASLHPTRRMRTPIRTWERYLRYKEDRRTRALNFARRFKSIPATRNPTESGPDLKQMGKDRETIAHFTATLKFTAKKLKPGWNSRRCIIAITIFAARQHIFRRALGLKPDNVNGLNNLAWMLATCPDGKVRNGREAIQLAATRVSVNAFQGYRCPSATLAAAYGGRRAFSRGDRQQRRRLAIANNSGEMQFVGDQRQLLELYRAGKSWARAVRRN